MANKYEAILRDFALSYPETTEEFPWGDRVIKVKKKVFVFLGNREPLSLSTKLPESSGMALMMPFASPTGYGLGKSGWVSASFDGTQEPPLDMLKQWIDESYRAVAPAKLVKQLGPVPTSGAKPGAAPSAKAPTKKAPTKKVPIKKVPTAKVPTSKAPTAKVAAAKTKPAPRKKK